jgi:hypothetical protein
VSKEARMIGSDGAIVAHLTIRRSLASQIIAPLAGLALAAGAVACAATPPPAVNTQSPPVPPTSTPGPLDLGTVSQSPADCILDGSKSPYLAGPVVLKAINHTENIAAFDLWRIVGNRSFEEFAEYIQADRDLAESGQPGLDHPGYVSNLITIELQAGETGTMEGTVVPGTYAIVCIRFFPQVGEPRPFSLIGPLMVE